MSARGRLRGDRAFFQSVLAIGLPIALQNLLSTTASMVDTAMLGTRGEIAVAAVGICSQFSSLLFSAYWGFSSGGVLFFAQYWGAKNEKGISRAYGVTLCCMLLVGLLFGGVAVLRPEYVLGIYTDKQAIMGIGVDYLRIVGFSYPLQVVAMAISALLRSTERVKVPLYASMLSLATNLFINWVLIFGKLGMPSLGVQGAAIGTVCAGVVNVLALYLLSAREKDSFLMRMRDQFRWTRGFLGEYFLKCAPIISNELLYGTGQMMINMVVGRQDEAAIAAMAVFRVIEGLIFAFFGGLASANSVMVGKRIGAGDHAGGYRDAKRFALLCPAVTLAVCLILLPLRAPLLRAFGLGEMALGYGMALLMIYTVVGTVRTCNYMMNNTFRAGGEPVFGTVFEISCLFLIAIPAVWLTGITWKMPFLVVFCMMYLDEFIRLFIGLWYLRSARWIRPVTEEGRATIEAFRALLKLKALADTRGRE